MSSLAMNEYGDTATAREFRDRFLDHGQKYSIFYCPYCKIELDDRCLYTECVRAPHFSRRTGEKHRLWCDQLETEAVGPIASESDDGQDERFTVLKRNVELPEALVRRRAGVIRFPIPTGLNVPAISEGEARRRAAEIRGAEIPQRQTTSMLREVVAAYERVSNKMRELARETGSKDDEMWSLVNDARESFPLDLYGDRLNYNTAIRSPKGGILDSARIYRGRAGQPDFHDGRLIIVASERFGPQPKDRNDPAANAQFVVFLPDPSKAEEAWQTRLRADLESAADRRQRVNWYAFGTPFVDNHHALLELASWADLHVDF